MYIISCKEAVAPKQEVSLHRRVLLAAALRLLPGDAITCELQAAAVPVRCFFFLHKSGLSSVFLTLQRVSLHKCGYKQLVIVFPVSRLWV